MLMLLAAVALGTYIVLTVELHEHPAPVWKMPTSTMCDCTTEEVWI